MALADPPDSCSRVVAHFDVDCFYAQAEVLRRPCLRDRPVGITQKFLVVTTNYVARGLGVPKMVSIDEARKK
jgi:DNA polymerase iota